MWRPSLARTFAAITAGVALMALTACGPAATVALSAPPDDATVYVLGDSWSTGYSADPGLGYVQRLAEATGWDVTTNAESGTGYVATLAATGEPFTARVAALPAPAPDLVIVQGGINDQGEVGRVYDAARQVFGDLHERYPDAQILALAPGTAAWPVKPELRSVSDSIRRAAVDDGVGYLSPLDEGWITEANFETFIDPETRHPSNEGHQLLATELLAALRG